MSRAHIVSPTELRLRQFLKTKPRVAPQLIATLLRLDEWTRSIHAGEAESPLRRKLIARASAPDPIRQIAENLIEHASGIERDLLLKSVQEVLFYSVKDRKSTRLNSSHRTISYAVFCLKKKK